MTDAMDWFRSNPMAMDLFSLCAGKRLGEGAYRVVHRCPWDQSLVFKFEVFIGTFSNVAEWDFWKQCEYYLPIKRWLAPCVAISDSGNVLIQKFTEDLPPDYRLPKKLPSAFTDIKRDNWGLYEGRLVCRDYAIHRVFNQGLNNRMRKATWTS
jgi:hypothetical protein